MHGLAFQTFVNPAPPRPPAQTFPLAPLQRPAAWGVCWEAGTHKLLQYYKHGPGSDPWEPVGRSLAAAPSPTAPRWAVPPLLPGRPSPKGPSLAASSTIILPTCISCWFCGGDTGHVIFIFCRVTSHYKKKTMRFYKRRVNIHLIYALCMVSH